MFDYFIKEKTQKAWISNAVLDGILTKGDDGEYYPNCDLDVIGVIPGVTGYHVNIRTREPIEFKYLTTIVKPATPIRTWL